ncbi:MAG: Isochorismate pyruvate lyase [Candidatus Erwinia impunctatus]|nr:Isochorismate pyruvate lyase [Culicoides impunctatus]
MPSMPKKGASECRDMTEIRECIDQLDQSVIRLLGERFTYVKAAAKFKKNATEVQAAGRFESMLLQRREWAEQQGLGADLIETVYRDLVNWFIAQEMNHWAAESTD